MLPVSCRESSLKQPGRFIVLLIVVFFVLKEQQANCHPAFSGDAKLNAPRLADLLMDVSVCRLLRSRPPGSSRESSLTDILFNVALKWF